VLVAVGLPRRQGLLPQMDLLLYLQVARADVAGAGRVVLLSRRRTPPKLRNNRLLLPRKKISPPTVCLPACRGSWANRILWNSS
jgi:hypothetical protein